MNEKRDRRVKSKNSWITPWAGLLHTEPGKKKKEEGGLCRKEREKGALGGRKTWWFWISLKIKPRPLIQFITKPGDSEIFPCLNPLYPSATSASTTVLYAVNIASFNLAMDSEILQQLGAF